MSPAALSTIFFPCDSHRVFGLHSGKRRDRGDGLGGREGIVGIALFLGGETIPARGIEQIAGSGFSARWTRLHGLVSDWRRVSTIA
jgi:hypothetical protein